MKPSNRENGSEKVDAVDDWIMAYENHVSRGGPSPGYLPPDMSGEEREQLANARRAIDKLQQASAKEKAAAEPWVTESLPQQLGDFRILNEVGRGGMGVVYEAEQISLPRRVALKILPFASVLDPRQLERFKNEALAAATLHHPGIVTVYSVGSERGVHFFAMQFIAGQSLAEMITEIQPDAQAEQETADRTRDGTESSKQPGSTASWQSQVNGGSTHKQAFFHQIAHLGAQVAAALDHAHTRGIVHRDIKPGNLLLDVEGRVHLADFGLARMGDDAGMTLTGDVLGTLRYMSPEQALAQRAVIDHRTDIYSLGATLYELLTLSPLFKGHDRRELLRKITLEEPRQPCKLNAKIPVDLETIVLKAIAKDPTDRYATAQAMADDLHRFIGGKPVQARRINANQRLWRWSKRNPIVATLSMSVAILATLVAIVALIGLAKTNGALAQAQRQEQLTAEQRDRAERQFQNAKDAVDRMLTTAGLKLANVPNSGPVRRQLLKDALKFYQGFLEQKSSDPAIRYETGLAYRRVARMRKSLGERAAARHAVQESIKIIEKLAEEFPENAPYREAIASNWTLLEGVAGNHEQTVRNAQRALAVWKELAAEYPDQPKYREEVAVCKTNLGKLRSSPEVIPYLQLAVVEWEQLHKSFPQLAKNFGGMAHSHHWLGMALLNVNRLAEAEEELLTSLALNIQRVEANPNSRWARFNQAQSIGHLGALRHEQGRIVEAETLYREGISKCLEVTHDFPGQAEFRKRLSGFLNKLALILSENGRGSEAEQLWRSMIKHDELLYIASPDDLQHVQRLGNALMQVGTRRYLADKLDEEAVRLFERTQEIYGTYLKNHADEQLILKTLADFLANCPAVQFRDPARAIDLAKPLLQQSPRDGDLWGILGAAHHAQAEWLKAIDAFEKANLLYGEGRAQILFPMAMSQWHLQQHEEARNSYAQAVENKKTLDRKPPEIQLLHREAARLLGIDTSTPSSQQESTE